MGRADRPRTPHETRDRIADFIHHWTDERTGLRPLQLVDWLRLPRNHWLADGEWDAIVNFAQAKSA